MPCNQCYPNNIENTNKKGKTRRLFSNRVNEIIYATQFRLRMTKDPNRSWATLMGIFCSLGGFQVICLPLSYILTRVMNIILRGFVVG